MLKHKKSLRLTAFLILISASAEMNATFNVTLFAKNTAKT
jgi:hypothetical protein